MRPLHLLAIVSALVAPTTVAADETGGFVVKLGTDTLSVERVVRTATQIRGEYVTRSPRSMYRVYTADLSPDGTVTRFEMTSRRLADGPGPVETHSTITFQGDSAVTTFPRGDSTMTTRLVAPRGSVPAIFGVMGLVEQLGRQARKRGARFDTLMTLSPGSEEATRTIVRKRGGDTLSYVNETSLGYLGPWFMRVDRNGRLLAYRGPGTPFQGETKRLADVDVAAARAAFANRPLGTLSVRDTARAALGDAAIWVDYGRPVKRGRTIFGSVVPWNAVWRTGANAATQFYTPVDLEIGGAPVPAGTYTLWTLPSPNGWKLIVNKQSGQWGTEYDIKQDFVRVDMRVETLPQPVEKFTIALAPDASGATLQLSWDTTRATVPVRRKPS
jgi:hypothetical protein